MPTQPQSAVLTSGPDRLTAWLDAVRVVYPEADAEGWDQVGLHVGDVHSDSVNGVLVTLDVTAEVLDEAAELGADLVIAHHPLLFRPLDRLTTQTASGRLALQAARQGCAIIAAHTNVDKAVDGTSHPAARVLGLTGIRPIVPTAPAALEAQIKIVTFVPTDHTDAVIRAMGRAHAGRIGDYTDCAFISPGTGTFLPGPGARPRTGEVGRRETVAEHRVEMIVEEHLTPGVIAALRAAHPYEEVPFDLYPMIQPSKHQPVRGLGLIGTLPAPLPLAAVARSLAEGLPSPHLRLAAIDPMATAHTVAICGGAGDSLIPRLLDYNEANPDSPVDVFVTGDLKHHVALDARTMGLDLIDAGHFATENPAMDAVLQRLEDTRESLDLQAPLHRSQLSTDPWTDWAATTPRTAAP